MASQDLVREAQDPSTSAARLAELAQADRALWPAIAVHPAAYPGLLEWLGQQGDPTVSAVLAMRSSSSAASPAPTEVIPQQVQPSAEQPTAEQPAAQQPAVEEPVAQAPVSPVAEPVVPSQPAEQSYQPVEPTQSYEPVQPTQTFQPVQPSAPAAYAAPADPSYGSVPPGGAAPTGSEPGGNGEDGSKKNFWLLAGMIAAVIVLIGAAAFGAIKVFGGDDDDDKDEASSSYTKAPLETTEPAPTTTAPTTAAPSVDPGASGASPAFCTQYKDLQDETLDSMGGGSDIGKLTESFGRLADAYDDLEDEAPAEVKGDVAVMSDYFDTFKDPSKVDPSDLSGKIREFTDAAQKVSQYYVSNCI